MRRAILITAAGGMLALLTGGNGLRKDELRCEEAVKRLQDCCPPFDEQTIRCEYIPGCEGPPIYPQITSQQADELDAESCDEIQAHNQCPGPLSSQGGSDAGR